MQIARAGETNLLRAPFGTAILGVMPQTSEPIARPATNPDAAEAVRRKVGAVMAASARIPPARLVARVHGGGDAAAFEKAGRAAALDIFAAVDDRISLEHRLRILDFGCGCARVLRFMAELAPRARLHGADTDGEAISWCLASYPHEVRRARFAFARTGDLPPLPYRSDSFDLVYGMSAFMRLPEDMQLKWLAELRRVAKPDGLLVLATRDDGAIRGELGPEDLRALDARGLHHRPGGGAGAPAERGGSAWLSRSYIDRVWSRYFHIAAHVPAGAPERGNLVVAVKRRPEAL